MYEEIDEIIDKYLEEIVGRKLLSADEVLDVLLDVKNVVTREKEKV